MKIAKVLYEDETLAASSDLQKEITFHLGVSKIGIIVKAAMATGTGSVKVQVNGIITNYESTFTAPLAEHTFPAVETLTVVGKYFPLDVEGLSKCKITITNEDASVGHVVSVAQCDWSGGNAVQ